MANNLNAIGASNPVSVSVGGTGAATLTDGGVLVGSGTSPITALALGSAGEVLTSNGAGMDPSFQPAGTGTAGVKITTYNVADSPATWTKDANAQFIRVIGWAGGGGGGSGRASAAPRSGGGGGTAGGAFDFSCPASFFGATETVTIGSGGAGGAGVSATNDGNPGTAGNPTSFGLLACVGGNPGGGGTTTTGAGAVGTDIRQLSNFGFIAGYSGGDGQSASQGSDGIGPSSTQASILGTAGGGGSPSSGFNGGAGGAIVNALGTTILAGGEGDLSGTHDGNDGGTGVGYICGGTGGGGSVGGSGVAGGNGGLPSGGGGGGCAVPAGVPSGAGGNGGDGRVIVIEYLS